MNKKDEYIIEMNKARQILDSNSSKQERLEAIMELCYGCALVAEENIKLNMEFDNAALMEDFLVYAQEAEQYNHLLEQIYNICSRIEKTVVGHPRLMARFKRFYRQVVYRVENAIYDGRELNLSSYLSEDISELERNIYYADKEQWQDISTIEHLKKDPIEWSEKYENVIDEVEKELYEYFKDEPRGMGFCFGYWFKKREILAQRGIEWKTPGEMNPKVRFD